MCVKQMKQAIDDILLNKRTKYKSWHDAQIKHQSLYTNCVGDLQYESIKTSRTLAS